MTSETYIVINIKCFKLISIIIKSLLVHKPGVDQKGNRRINVIKGSTNNFLLTIHPIN